MKWDEFVAKVPAFKLAGGPFDGNTVPTCTHSAWPSFIYMNGPLGTARYAMRIGDLEHYDFDGTEERTP